MTDLLAIIDQLSERLHEIESHTLPVPAESRPENRTARPDRWTGFWYRAKLGFYKALRNRRGAIKYKYMLASLNRPIGNAGKIGILSPPHTAFVARAIERVLAAAGLEAVAIDPAEHPVFDLGLYIVLCPQVFLHLPPGDKMVIFQFEQCQAPLWQDERYLKLLRSARAVLDYSTDNLAKLAERGIEYPKTFHVGVQAQGQHRVDIDLSGPDEEPIDVLFYGAMNDVRRHVLSEVARQIPIRIETNLFGEALHALLRRTRVVLNIHYYEDAPLETTRIHECLSFGAQVVSETCADQIEHGHLAEWVGFVELGNVEAMVAAIRERLARPQPDPTPLLEACDTKFRYQFGRFLLAQQLIDERKFQELTLDWQIPSDTICLSLPESVDRHRLVRHKTPLGARIFEGLRQPLGWQGCALSYKFLCRKALEQDLPDLLVFEDDAVLNPETERRLKSIRRMLGHRQGDWDIFAALIADLHQDTRVLHVEEYEGRTLVTIDRMTSMVCNIYGRRAMDIISRWKIGNRSIHRNTIDRYLEQYPGLRVVTTLPFLAGHRSESQSTLWGIQNSQYDPMIAASQQRLQDKVDDFLRARAARPLQRLAA
ncbi:hypothetical protein ACWA7J_00710 [Leptothrix sp. BB-4]